MRNLTKLRLRLRSLFRSGRVERELDDELRYHVDEREDGGVRADADGQRDSLPETEARTLWRSDRTAYETS